MSGIGILRAGATTYLRSHAFSEALVSILPDYEKLSLNYINNPKHSYHKYISSFTEYQERHCADVTVLLTVFYDESYPLPIKMVRVK